MRPGQIGDAAVPVREMREDSPSGWIGQGRERPIQCSRIIFNHLVKY